MGSYSAMSLFSFTGRIFKNPAIINSDKAACCLLVIILYSDIAASVVHRFAGFHAWFGWTNTVIDMLRYDHFNRVRIVDFLLHFVCFCGYFPSVLCF
jgi:hypothetical protein